MFHKDIVIEKILIMIIILMTLSPTRTLMNWLSHILRLIRQNLYKSISSIRPATFIIYKNNKSLDSCQIMGREETEAYDKEKSFGCVLIIMQHIYTQDPSYVCDDTCALISSTGGK